MVYVARLHLTEPGCVMPLGNVVRCHPIGKYSAAYGVTSAVNRRRPGAHLGWVLMPNIPFCNPDLRRRRVPCQSLWALTAFGSGAKIYEHQASCVQAPLD